MRVGSLFEFDMEEYFARVIEANKIFSTSDLAGHRKEMQFFAVLGEDEGYHEEE